MQIKKIVTIQFILRFYFRLFIGDAELDPKGYIRTPAFFAYAFMLLLTLPEYIQGKRALLSTSNYQAEFWDPGSGVAEAFNFPGGQVVLNAIAGLLVANAISKVLKSHDSSISRVQHITIIIVTLTLFHIPAILMAFFID